MIGELHTSRWKLRPMHDHHAFTHRRARYMLQCERDRLPSHRSRNICALALHSLDDGRGIPAVGVWSKKYRITFLDGTTVEQAIYNCADIGHRPDIRH